jgi:hypothetical protein
LPRTTTTGKGASGNSLRRNPRADRDAQASGRVAVGLRDTALRLTPGAVMGALSRRLAEWSESVEKRTAG